MEECHLLANAIAKASEPWRHRLIIPNYKIADAAKYADVTAQTVAHWHSNEKTNRSKLSARAVRAELSYMQLIEVAVVSSFRKAGVTLSRIYEAREYIKSQLRSEYPFAQYKFKSDGKHILMDYEQFDPKSGKGKLLVANQGGQLAWSEILDRLQQFEYEKDGIALLWHIGGRESQITIDPRVSFGAPAIKGVATWAIAGRWSAGDDVAEIAADFGLPRSAVIAALKFEGVSERSGSVWVN
jgi:uncharacterized protein (DUF433 family)